MGGAEKNGFLGRLAGFFRKGILLGLLLATGGGVGGRVMTAHAGETRSGNTVIRLAAAADLKEVLSKAIPAFRHETGIGVRVSYGPSGLLFLQIEHQAPFDVFMSADAFYADRIAKEGAGIPSGDVVYARGRLALYLSPGDPVAASVSQLSSPAIRRIAFANPRMAPYGKLAMACLIHSGVWKTVRAKTVMGDNVAQVAQYLDTGAVDAGLLPFGMANKLALRKKGTVVRLPSSCTGVLLQKMIVLQHSRKKAQAIRFQQFLLGPEGQAFFRKAGYPPLGKTP